MTKEDYFKFAESFYQRLLDISKAKNADYTGGDPDPFANFTAVEQYKVKTEHGFITRMSDKMMRIASFINVGDLQVKDESVMDTLGDLANYCVLLAGYLRNKQENSVVKGYKDRYPDE
jgi:ribosomal protein L10